MDQHDLEACGIEKDIRHYKCSAQQDLQLKASSLSDHETFSSEVARFRKQLPYHDHEIKRCEAAKLPKTERKCLSYGNASATDCTKQNTDHLRTPCSVVSGVSDSASMNKSCAKGTVMVMSPRNVLANERNSKDFDISSHSVGANNCSDNISLKKESSSKVGETPDKHENKLVDGKIARCWLNTGENRLKSIVQGTYLNKQLKTDSSSSNSTHAIFPASWDDSCEEVSVHEKPSQCCLTDVSDIMLLQGKPSNLDSVSEVSDNVRVGSDKLLGEITDLRSIIVERDDILKSSLPRTEYAVLPNQDKAENCYELDVLDVARKVAREVEQEVGTDREASGNSSCILVRSCENAHVNAADSLAIDKGNYFTETGGETQFCCEQDNCHSFCSNRVMVNQEMLVEEQQMHLDNVDSSLDLGSTITCAANCSQESSCIVTNSDDVAANDRIIQPFQIDLNEDILVNDGECSEQLIEETVSCHVHNVSKPTPAMAKSGLVYFPLSQLRLENAVGWRGPAATSAFRPTSHSKNFKGIPVSSGNSNGDCSKDLQVKGIDLNIAAAVDFDMELLQEKCVPKSSSLPSKESLMEISLTEAEKFNIDLNFADKNNDNFFQMATSTSARNIGRDFDLNDNPTSQDVYGNGDQPSQWTLESGDRASDIPAVFFLGNAAQQKFNNLDSAHWESPGPMHVFSHGLARPFLLAVSNVLPTAERMQEIFSLHDKASYKPNPLQQPTVAFPYGNRSCTEPTSCLSSTVETPCFIPYITDENGSTVFQQLVDPVTLPAFSRAPSFMQIPDGPGPNNLSVRRPGFDLRSGLTYENRSMGENIRQHFIPLSDSSMEEKKKCFQPVVFPVTSMKRREPEGGWDPRH